jgi:uncharacterized membrane protein YbhN (UPF0104 family)
VEAAAVAVLLYCVGAYLLRHWREIRAYPWDVDHGTLAAATLLAALSLALWAWLWTAIVRAMGERVTYRQGMPVWLVSALARYVPGKVWQMSGIVYLSRRQGFDPMHALAANFLMQLLVVAIGILAFVLAVPAQVTALGGRGFEIASAVVAVALVALYLSPFFEHLYASLLGRLRKPAPAQRFSLSQKLLFGLAATLGWLLWGTSFWLFLEAVTGRNPPLPVAIGICAAGYVGGFLAVFSPGGLGVRESLYAVLLGPYMPSSVALAAALLNRLWLTLIELALAAASSLAAGGRAMRLGAAAGTAGRTDA